MASSSSPNDRPLSVVAGAAGFIGSHLVDRLLAEGHVVIGLDNFVRGERGHLAQALTQPHFLLLDADCSDATELHDRLGAQVGSRPVDTFWHLAANSDIAAGTADPRIDLRDTFMTTFAVLDVMRRLAIKQIAFASSSAIYGARPDPIHEDDGPLLPASNYGAMKLASEGSISAAVEDFVERAWILRFPNVVGPRATHGVIFDLIRKLQKQPETLEVLGDGNQCKPYLHVTDLIDAMWFIRRNGQARLNVYNIGPEDSGATVRFIAEEVVRAAAARTPLAFTGGERGWVGDVPRFCYDIGKLRRLGWSIGKSSQDAVRVAARELFAELSRP